MFCFFKMYLNIIGEELKCLTCVHVHLYSVLWGGFYKNGILLRSYTCGSYLVHLLTNIVLISNTHHYGCLVWVRGPHARWRGTWDKGRVAVITRELISAKLLYIITSSHNQSAIHVCEKQ